MRPLILPGARRPAAALATLGAALFLALAVYVWHGSTTALDTRIGTHAGDLGAQGSLARRWWLAFSEPAVSIAVPVVVGGWALVRRRWRVLALTALGPALALLVTEVAKAVVARVIGPLVFAGSRAGAVSGSYPSGHETGTVAWLVLLAVLVLRGAGSARGRVTTLAAATLWALAAAVGLTVNYYHYATDTLGAIGSTVAVLLAIAFAVDAVADRRAGLSSPDGRDRTRTAHAA